MMTQKIKQKQEVSIHSGHLCINLKSPSNRHRSNSVTPTKHLNKYVRLMQSFKPKIIAKKKRFATNETQTPSLLTLEDDLILIPNRKISTPLLRQSSNNKKPKQLQANPQLSHKNLSKSSDFQTLSRSKKHSFPSISFLKVDVPTTKRYSIAEQQQKIHNPRIYTQKPVNPLVLIKSQKNSNFPRVSLNKVEGAPNGNLLEFSRMKPTQQHFSKMQNVRIAQKLLLMQPSKDLRKSEQTKFYNQQKTYRQRISQSTLIKKNKLFNQMKIQEKKHMRIKSQWID